MKQKKMRNEVLSVGRKKSLENAQKGYTLWISEKMKFLITIAQQNYTNLYARSLLSPLTIDSRKQEKIMITTQIYRMPGKTVAASRIKEGNLSHLCVCTLYDGKCEI